jgi:hypothetical protein
MDNPNDLVKFYERQYGPFVHMAELDKAIWIRYLMQGGASLSPFLYDVRVGKGLDMGAAATGFEVRTAYALTTKRIDVVALRGSTTVIIEVKQRAGLGSIGQMIGYRQLYMETVPGSTDVEMLLVTDTLQPDMVPLLIENNIRYYEVGL